MNFLKKLYKRLYQKYEGRIDTFAPILIIIFVFYLMTLYSNSPLERFIRLSPEDRVSREDGLKKIDSIINTCKSINSRHTRQKPYQYWFEDINSFGKWYQPRLSYPIIGVYFNEESGHSDSGSYCEVDLYWFEYEFYNWETFEIGEDQNGQTHYQSFKNHMCDDSDTNDVRRCTR